MAKVTADDTPSLQEHLTKGGPVTHCFYEYQGERIVAPELLIGNAIVLWHEQVFADEASDNSHLWAFAAEVLGNREPTPMYSWIEWVRNQITLGSIAPSGWDGEKPYPYKGLLISAVYLQEARRLCEIDQQERAWHIVALAYYHLGLNTGPSTLKNTSRAAKMMHAARTEKVRAIVHGALDAMKGDKSIKGLAAAKDRVVEILRKFEPDIRDVLHDFDSRLLFPRSDNDSATPSSPSIEPRCTGRSYRRCDRKTRGTSTSAIWYQSACESAICESARSGVNR